MDKAASRIRLRLSPLGNTISKFSAKNFCRYGVIASRFHCNGDAITV